MFYVHACYFLCVPLGAVFVLYLSMNFCLCLFHLGAIYSVCAIVSNVDLNVIPLSYVRIDRVLYWAGYGRVQRALLIPMGLMHDLQS